MNAQLIEYIQTSTGLQKNTVESVLSAFVKYIQISLTQKFSVNLLKFGTFSVRFLDEREGRNPKTGENITISAKWKPRFKFSADFVVNPDPVAEFEAKEPKIWHFFERINSSAPVYALILVQQNLHNLYREFL